MEDGLLSFLRKSTERTSGRTSQMRREAEASTLSRSSSPLAYGPHSTSYSRGTVGVVQPEPRHARLFSRRVCNVVVCQSTRICSPSRFASRSTEENQSVFRPMWPVHEKYHGKE